MKKVLALVAVFVMMPLAAFAKTAVSDSDLGAVTGQAGVSIALDVTIPTLNIGVVALGDADGDADSPVLDPASAPGYVGLANVAANDIYVGLDLTAPVPALLTIDIATVAAGGMYAGLGLTGASYVAIGLPTAIVKVGNLDASIQIGATDALGLEILSLHITDLSLTIGRNAEPDIAVGVPHPFLGRPSFIHVFAH